MRLIDFGQVYGKNIQMTYTNVETGTKFLNKIVIEPSPLLWKIDYQFTIESEDEVHPTFMTKIIEKVPNTNYYICSISVSTFSTFKLVNLIESGLEVLEYLPTILEPTITNKEIIWEADERLSASFVLKGNLATKPLPPKIIIQGKEYTCSPSSLSSKRVSKIISILFNHVALFRKMLGEE